jgi:branched-subunit amino acid transport protein
MSLWTVILLAALGTFLFRVTLLVALRNVTLPAALERLTDLVLPVAMAAILGAAVFHTATAQPPADTVALLAGSVVTVLVVRRTGSLLAAVAAGLLVAAGGGWLIGLL